MSQRMPEKPQKPPPWWIPITFTVVLGWLFNNLITIVTFLVTGVVRIGHIGVGPFVLALSLSVLMSALGFVLGVRLCIYLVGSIIATIFHLGRERLKNPPKRDEAAREEADALFQAMMKQMHPPSEPQPPPTRWERVREAMGYALSAVLMWLFVPKRFRP